MVPDKEKMRELSLSKKLVITAITLLLVPIALIWIIVVGTLMGILGTIIGTLESIIIRTKTEYMLWRRYPKRNNKLYYIKKRQQVIQTQQTHPDPTVDTEKELDKLKEKYNSGQLVAPSPLIFGLLWSVIYLIGILPFALLASLFTGPLTVARDCHFAWQKHILGNKNAKKYHYISHLLTESEKANIK